MLNVLLIARDQMKHYKYLDIGTMKSSQSISLHYNGSRHTN